jgi:predicted O-linked N-acetylglucosamine transferase (SPINDLY family)
MDSKRSKPGMDEALQAYRAGNEDLARALCQQVLLVAPDHVPALSLLGKMDLKAGNLEEAVRTLERAVRLAPTSVIDLCNLGVAHHRLKHLDRAVETLAKAVQLDPQKATAIFNLGLALLDRGDTDKGLLCLARAAQLNPASVAVQTTLARELMRLGRIDEAITRFRRATELDPKDVPVSLELAHALGEGDCFAEGEALVRALLSTMPESTAARVTLGRLLSLQRRHSEALEQFQEAIALGYPSTALANPIANALGKQGRVDEALDHLRDSLRQDPTLEHVESNLVFQSAFSPRYEATELLEIAQRWSAHHAGALVTKRRAFQHDRTPDRRLRVAYVSPDFCGHVQRLYTLPVLRNHDRSAHQIICYSSVKKPDLITSEIKSHADEWYEVNDLKDAQLAQKIRDDRIDVLIDLTMHMDGSRLKVFAEKPAPVQITWLAYPGTTGLDGMDYRITDPTLDPPGSPLPYTEQSLWLPSAFWCYDPSGDDVEVAELPAASAGHVTFGCLNNFMKVNQPVLELWARVLASVQGSRMVVLAPEGWPRSRVVEVFEARGVSQNRVEFIAQQGRRDYLATYSRIDIALDTFPYNGHTTSLDAFWMGVPVITLVGNTIVGRAGLCLAQNLELNELIANVSGQFVEIATGLAGDLPRLGELRAALRKRMERSPLMDAPGFTRALEDLYREAWRRWCAQ